MESQGKRRGSAPEDLRPKHSRTQGGTIYEVSSLSGKLSRQPTDAGAGTGRRWSLGSPIRNVPILQMSQYLRKHNKETAARLLLSDTGMA